MTHDDDTHPQNHPEEVSRTVSASEVRARQLVGNRRQTKTGTPVPPKECDRDKGRNTAALLRNPTPVSCTVRHSSTTQGAGPTPRARRASTRSPPTSTAQSGDAQLCAPRAAASAAAAKAKHLLPERTSQSVAAPPASVARATCLGSPQDKEGGGAAERRQTASARAARDPAPVRNGLCSHRGPPNGIFNNGSSHRRWRRQLLCRNLHGAPPALRHHRSDGVCLPDPQVRVTDGAFRPRQHWTQKRRWHANHNCGGLAREGQ